MDDLVQWLRDQLDAEAEEARLTADAFGSVWTTDDAMESVSSDTGADVVSEPYVPRSFIAAHDPARVLREIDAKRRTLIRCEEAMLAANPMLVHFAKQTAWEMAQLYSDRPGYKAEEWAP